MNKMQYYKVQYIYIYRCYEYFIMLDVIGCCKNVTKNIKLILSSLSLRCSFICNNCQLNESSYKLLDVLVTFLLGCAEDLYMIGLPRVMWKCISVDMIALIITGIFLP